MFATRYFLNIAYIGTPFRGSQRQVRGGFPRINDPSTVQGMLEMGLKTVKDLDPSQDPVVFMASRTDAGVHALNATCHFNLYRTNENKIIEPDVIKWVLNNFFYKKEVPIRILNSQIVPSDFHSRNMAISRTYLYRLIVGICNPERKSPFYHFVPIEEVGRVHFFCTDNFNIDVMRQAASMMEGFHDFRTFMGQTSDNVRQTRKEIFSINIVERRREDLGVASLYSWPSIVQVKALPDSHLILDILFKGKGFLYKQVRRTAGTLVAAATGRITLKDIQFMLQVPSKHSWISSIKTLPGHGLYLCEIEY